MKWEITIITGNPNLVEGIIQQNIGAITHNDIDHFSIDPIDVGD